MVDIGQRVNKFFPQYQRHYTGYVVAQPEPEDAEELYVVFYPEDNDEETMTRADVQKWDDGMLGDGGDDNLGDGCVVDEQDLLGTLLRAYYARQDVEVGVPQHGGGGGGGGDAGGSAKAHAQQQGGDDTRSSNNTEKPPAKEKQRKLKQKAQKSKGPNVASARNNTKRPPARPGGCGKSKIYGDYVGTIFILNFIDLANTTEYTGRIFAKISVRIYGGYSGLIYGGIFAPNIRPEFVLEGRYLLRIMPVLRSTKYVAGVVTIMTMRDGATVASPPSAY